MQVAPKLRPDLVYATYVRGDGQEDIVVSDPVAAKYFRLSKYEMAFLKALDGTVGIEEAAARLRNSGRYYSSEHAKSIFGKAAQAGLLLGTPHGTSGRQLELKQAMDKAKKLKTVSSLFYLYVPLLNPDRFLERTLRCFRLICNKWTGALFLLLLPGALYMIADGLARMRGEYLFFFNVRNGLYLSLAIAGTKIIHEFSHAYVAKGFGLRVPVLGVGFILFFPVMYCDTTDAWVLADRKQRMAISGAGILAEIVMAVLALYIWYFTQPGIVNSIAFYQMSYSLLSTILFNGNPLTKFDGYFVLMDLVRQPNLADKAQGQIKYLWMNRVLGLTKWKSTASNTKETFFFTLYGAMAFMYRLSLVFGIIAGIYSRFDKTLGIVLAVVASVLNVGVPVTKGLSSLLKNRGSLRPRLRGTLVFIVLVLVAARLAVWPWSSKSVFPCYVDSARIQKLTVPLMTSVGEVLVKDGDPVREGDVLFRLDASELKLSLLQRKLERDALKAEVEMMLADTSEKERANAASKEIEVRKKNQEIEKIARDLNIALKGVVAPFDGVVTQLDSRVEPGFRPGEGVVVGELKSKSQAVAYAMVPEPAMDRISQGAPVTIWFPLRTGIQFQGTLQHIRAYGERDLANTPFTSAVGGDVATEEVQADRGIQGHERVQAPLEAQYIGSYLFDNSEFQIPLGAAGRMVVASPPRSLLTRLHNRVLHAFYRESLF